MTRRAVFIDRDGTLNAMVYDETHGTLDSPRRPEQVVLLPGAAGFLKGVKDLGFLAVVVTNQPGLAKGTMTEDDLAGVNQRLAELLSAEGASWDDLQYCPHHPDGGSTPQARFVGTCKCRKPLPGMLIAAAKKHGIDLSGSWMIGDGLNDMTAGQAAGCRTLLLSKLKLEQIERFFEPGAQEPDRMAASLDEALTCLRDTERSEPSVVHQDARGVPCMKANGSVPELSVVIPVYNSAAIFPELYRRLTLALKDIVSSFEIVAIVDGCRDRSFDVIAELAEKDPRIKAVEFSRNFGHQAAITAGIEMAEGAMVTIMDDDLEDPPEVLSQFVAKMNEGYDVVYGIRRKRKRSLLHRMLYSLFYRVLRRMVAVDMPRDAGDFCLMSRRVVDVLNAMPESNRYLRGLRAWSGFEQIGLEYERSGRFSGKTGYSVRKYFLLALDAIFSFSYKPLGYLSMIGTVIALASFLHAISVLVSGRNPLAPGWASIFVLILFFSGIQLLSIGIIGQYLARVYDEVKRRPKYIIKRAVGVVMERENG